MGTNLEVLLGDEDGEGIKWNGCKWLKRWRWIQWREEVEGGMSGMEEDTKDFFVLSEYNAPQQGRGRETRGRERSRRRIQEISGAHVGIWTLESCLEQMNSMLRRDYQVA